MKIEQEKIGWDKVLFGAGILLIVLGVFHVPIQALNSRDWESPIGWRKPILFGISTGITLLSLAWVAAQIQAKHHFTAWLISILAVVEVSIITVQTWRGVPAHFNNGTNFDKIAATSIDVILIFITFAIFYLTLASFRKTFAPENADYWFAMRWGMFLLTLSCLFGFGVAIYGNFMIAEGKNPELVAPHGVPKFVHGIALHALQVFPLWVLFMRKINVNLPKRLKSLKFATAAFFLVTLYALWQTLNGLGRFEVNFGGLLIFTTAAICGIFALIYAKPARIT